MENFGLSAFMCKIFIDSLKEKSGLEGSVKRTGILMLKTESVGFFFKRKKLKGKGILLRVGEKERNRKTEMLQSQLIFLKR